MSQEDLLARLEAVTARLEKAASRMGGGGGGDDDDDAPGYVTELQGVVNAHLPKVVAACKDLGLESGGDILKRAYDNVVDFVARVPQAKKPTPVCLHMILFFFIVSFFFVFSVFSRNSFVFCFVLRTK